MTGKTFWSFSVITSSEAVVGKNKEASGGGVLVVPAGHHFR